MIRPPAKSSVTPVIQRAESEARNSAAIAGSTLSRGEGRRRGMWPTVTLAAASRE
jgi:hypothetical protein